MRALPYVHPVVRDLAWCLGSPPLLAPGDDAIHWPGPPWYTQILAEFHPHLLRLDSDPQPLLQRLAACRDRRLGAYFETLWRYWLEHNARYRLLAANLPVRAGGRTLGEFDLIVTDRDSGRTLHWELAVKFYLGEGDTSDPHNWVGRARHDRLAIKTAHLLQRQTRLSTLAEAGAALRAHGIRIDEHWVIMKGRLFYPDGAPPVAPAGADPSHLRGAWLRANRLERQAPACWGVLEKSRWLAPLAQPPSDVYSTAELARRLNESMQDRPLCAATFIDGEETGRWFVVPDDWGSRPADFQPL